MPYQPADLRPEQVISPSKLKERIEKEDIFTIDVRNPSEIQEGCFISTRRHTNIPYPELENALKLSNDDFKAKYGVDKPSGTGSDLVFYCGIGIRGSLATVAAEKVGLNKPEQVVSANKLKGRIATEDIFIIDVRNPSEIQEGAFIKVKRNLNIPFPDLENALNLNNEDFKAKYDVDKPSGTGSDVVFHCGHGARGSKATDLARKLGLNKSQNLSGGYASWAAEQSDK